jgi:hypothetical protein
MPGYIDSGQRGNQRGSNPILVLRGIPRVLVRHVLRRFTVLPFGENERTEPNPPVSFAVRFGAQSARCSDVAK